MNKRITAKERGLLKGSIRRVFARSELRQRVLDAAQIIYEDVKRPRVKKWSKCAVCLKPTPKYLAAVDHKEPVILVSSSFEEQGMDITVNRTWCSEENLQVICEECHDSKTKAERAERKRLKKEKAK